MKCTDFFVFCTETKNDLKSIWDKHLVAENIKKCGNIFFPRMIDPASVTNTKLEMWNPLWKLWEIPSQVLINIRGLLLVVVYPISLHSILNPKKVWHTSVSLCLLVLVFHIESLCCSEYCFIMLQYESAL